MSYIDDNTWRKDESDENPAGPLFAGGEYAAADVTADLTIKTIAPHCTPAGTACTGTKTCC